MHASSEEIRNVILHIIQDGAEKVEEIEVSAEEEFQYERCQEIFRQMDIINQKYLKKNGTVLKNETTEHSKMKNVARLAVLLEKEALLQSVVVEAKKKLADLEENSSLFGKILRDLIIQGLCKLMEKEVTIRCRPKDRSIVSGVMRDASDGFAHLCGIKTHLTIDKKISLPDTSFSGVILIASDTKISVNNSLEHRLEDITHLLVPELLSTLFNQKTHVVH